MLGTLMTYLRMCGYDTAYALDRDVEDDGRILSIAHREGRMLVTRDRELARRAEREGVEAILLEKRDVIDQLRELAAVGFDLFLPEEPSRCSRCNAPVEPVQVSGDADTDRRPDYVPDDERCIWRCEACDQWYWKGSHWADVAARLETLQSAGETSSSSAEETSNSSTGKNSNERSYSR